MLQSLKSKESQIIQQNRILTGGQTINLRARQIIYVLAAFMDRNNATAEIVVSAKEFLNFINNDAKDRWSDIYSLTDDIFEHLNDNPILIKKPKGKDYLKINWLSSLGVSQGMIRARFSVDIAEYFMYKQGLPYTKLLWDLRVYKSNFTARILDLFQKHHLKGSGDTEIKFQYNLEELKLFFGVHDKYTRLYDFEKRVLQVARKELEENDVAPYWFIYTKIKKGKRVGGIEFEVYVRPEALLKMAPELEFIANGKSSNQISLFAQKEKISDEKERLISILIEKGLKEQFSLNIIFQLTESQGRGYCQLIDYGVNRSLAFTIVTKQCSFGEIVGYEDYYIQHTLNHIEKARIKRLEEAAKTKNKKRTTPKEKRGGLAKSIFEKQQYFSSFMEQLSSIRNSRTVSRNKKQDHSQKGMQSLGDLINHLKSENN